MESQTTNHRDKIRKKRMLEATGKKKTFIRVRCSQNCRMTENKKKRLKSIYTKKNGKVLGKTPALE